MPSLGADMESGTLLEWRVAPGEAVKRGDIVAVVDTSKAEIEVEIFEDGVIDELLVPEGTRVPVGTPLASLRATANDGVAQAEPPRPAEEPATPVEPAPVATPPPAMAPVAVAPPQPSPSHEHRLRVSPVARRVAEQLGVDLAAVTGSGPDGAITKADVESAAAAVPTMAARPPVSESPGVAAPAVAPPSGAPSPAASSPTAPTPTPAASTDRQAAMREAIGALMARSKREIPHYYLECQIDMSRALEWLGEENLKRPVSERLLPSALLLGAVAHAAAQTPSMNGFWVDGAFKPAGGVHLGVAISLRGGGLIAPALHDADRKSLDELMEGLHELVKRARGGRLRSSEMSDPTITVTNLGERGVDLVHGVIYPPQVALVGFGGIRERPWASGGMVGARPVVHATLAADHRAGDGHAGSRFLALIDRLLQTPEEL
ncbi:MAG: dihydrolipoamide acetyltransferase family protein [Arthrospira platensis]